jgi:hypothetical protein
MALAIFQSRKERENFYRCPACGEKVDNRLRDAVLFHHYHVLHPQRDSFVRLPVVPSMKPTPGRSLRKA